MYVYICMDVCMDMYIYIYSYIIKSRFNTISFIYFLLNIYIVQMA